MSHAKLFSFSLLLVAACSELSPGETPEETGALPVDTDQETVDSGETGFENPTDSDTAGETEAPEDPDAGAIYVSYLKQTAGLKQLVRVVVSDREIEGLFPSLCAGFRDQCLEDGLTAGQEVPLSDLMMDRPFLQSLELAGGTVAVRGDILERRSRFSQRQWFFAGKPDLATPDDNYTVEITSDRLTGSVDLGERVLVAPGLQHQEGDGFLRITEASSSVYLSWEPVAEAEYFLVHDLNGEMTVLSLPEGSSEYVLDLSEVLANSDEPVIGDIELRQLVRRQGELDGIPVYFETITDDTVSVGEAIGSCKDLQGTSTPSGLYSLIDGTGTVRQVYCDQQTDGGGWTMVASSSSTFDDLAVDYNSELTNLYPVGGMLGVWDGLRGVVDPSHDIRFACKVNKNNAAMSVDLSFYSVDWYNVITTGPNDSDSCFNESNGSGWGTPPARKNNLTGLAYPLGAQYGAGYMESEDSCGDTSDFTVDLNDRGMDSNQNDGTDWGEDDSSQKCGSTTAAGSGAWFIFVR